MNSTRTRDKATAVQFEDPPFVKALFGSTAWAWLWLVVRLYIGYRWLTSGFGKLSNPAWTQTGDALKGYWQNAVRLPEPPARPPISFDWYRSFLETLLAGEHYVWFSKLVVAGEILVGLALVLGVFTGIAAFFGAFMNWNFMMAGTASINPVLFPLAILLVLAWKVAGWWGLDRWVLPALGTPWRPGTVFRRTDQSAPAETEPSRSPG
jgi:thiosulfate dehydrogenase [quinone] large subunit